jgi:cytochrome c-type biogenesis protein CcmE
MEESRMTQLAWEKPENAPEEAVRSGIQWKYLIGLIALFIGIGYLILQGTVSGARYFISVDELLSGDYVGKTVRISGAVIGESIRYDPQNLIIDFTIANIPTETKDLARTLYEAAHDPNATRLAVHVRNQVKPDLLQNEAQAILTGKLGADGVFYATEVLLKCPSRYEEVAPNQAIADPLAGK